MDRPADLGKTADPERALLTIEDVRRILMQERSSADDLQRPINIQINLGDRDDRMRRGRDEVGFRPWRSKLVWAVVAFAVSASVAYARTRYVCQSFKDEGRFYYGMGVERCVGLLIKQPFEPLDRHLETINRSY